MSPFLHSRPISEVSVLFALGSEERRDIRIMVVARITEFRVLRAGHESSDVVYRSSDVPEPP